MPSPHNDYDSASYEVRVANSRERASDALAAVSEPMLRAVLDQSPDCIKIISDDGSLDYMNRNGQCAMEIDDFGLVAGQRWSSLWPEESQHRIEEALGRAKGGELVHLHAQCPTAKGNPRWWDVSVSSYNIPNGQTGYVSISRDITEVVQAREAAEAVAAEMRHRLSNAYQVIAGLISSFAAGDADKEAFAHEIVARLGALAAAQNLQPTFDGVYSLPTLIAAVVDPYQTPQCCIDRGGIPDCVLNRANCDALAMVLGELCVNSMKHGALGSGGQITVDGQRECDELTLHWREFSHCPVKRHSRPGGKGLTIMSRVLGASNGAIQHNWRADGVDVAIKMSNTR